MSLLCTLMYVHAIHVLCPTSEGQQSSLQKFLLKNLSSAPSPLLSHFLARGFHFPGTLVIIYLLLSSADTEELVPFCSFACTLSGKERHEVSVLNPSRNAPCPPHSVLPAEVLLVLLSVPRSPPCPPQCSQQECSLSSLVFPMLLQFSIFRRSHFNEYDLLCR